MTCDNDENKEKEEYVTVYAENIYGWAYRKLTTLLAYERGTSWLRDGGWRKTFYSRLSNTFYVVNHVQNLVSVQKKEMKTVQYSEYNIKGRKN